ncbi:Hypothetical predicted protein [Octopus vulgaris]|uniref:Uncharacterized protein n=1 Tax=Octopus vulgaris TaxID=6645 RepID=A0AA36BJF5_OCTVU|nr:Hypothetical predicted protein [Octopus vulgaris]
MHYLNLFVPNIICHMIDMLQRIHKHRLNEMDMKNIKVYPTREETIPTYNNVAFQENGNEKDSITKSGALKNESNKTANAKTESTITGATNIESITVESSKIGNRDEGNYKDGSNEDESDKQGISKEENVQSD